MNETLKVTSEALKNKLMINKNMTQETRASSAKLKFMPKITSLDKPYSSDDDNLQDKCEFNHQVTSTTNQDVVDPIKSDINFIESIQEEKVIPRTRSKDHTTPKVSRNQNLKKTHTTEELP